MTRVGRYALALGNGHKQEPGTVVWRCRVWFESEKQSADILQLTALVMYIYLNFIGDYSPLIES